ncbi:MAG: hypothetical protein IH630_05780 [Thermoplasmata archaeon]|nr:hypothetical protein [Thermoplasmata archaeon]
MIVEDPVKPSWSTRNNTRSFTPHASAFGVNVMIMLPVLFSPETVMSDSFVVYYLSSLTRWYSS